MCCCALVLRWSSMCSLHLRAKAHLSTPISASLITCRLMVRDSAKLGPLQSIVVVVCGRSLTDMFKSLPSETSLGLPSKVDVTSSSNRAGRLTDSLIICPSNLSV